MTTRHDTRWLENALETSDLLAKAPAVVAAARAQAEETLAAARARAEELRANGDALARKRLATGAAIAIAAVGIGLGLWLALPNLMDRWLAPLGQTAGDVLPPELRERLRKFTERPAPAAARVVTNFTVFNVVELKRFGRVWPITTGHDFVVATDPTWSSAWCYVPLRIAEVDYRLTLAERPTPASPPYPVAPSLPMLEAIGIDASQAAELAKSCSWLDGPAPTSLAAPDANAAAINSSATKRNVHELDEHLMLTSS